MSDVLKHLINYLSNVFGVSDIVNYSNIQLSDISCMSNVLNHLNIVCPLNIHWILDQNMKGKYPGWFLCYYTLLTLLSMLIIPCPPNPMVSQLNIQCQIRWTCVRHGWNIDQLTCNHHIYSIIHRHPLGRLKQHYVTTFSSYLTHIWTEGSVPQSTCCLRTQMENWGDALVNIWKWR